MMQGKGKAAVLAAVACATTLLGFTAIHDRAARAETRPGETSTAPAPVPAEPQSTTASFGDWVVRCVTAGKPSKRSCEASQSLVVQNQGRQIPIAQIAFGRPDDGAPLQLTVLLPDNVSFDKPVKFGADEDHLATLSFRRCLPNGCYASAASEFGLIRSLRTATKPGRLVFTDGSEHTLTLPLSLRGLPQALDDLNTKH